MRGIFHQTKTLTIFALSAFLVSCISHDFDRDKENEDPSGSVNGIPDNFDFSTTASHELTVKVKDEYNGKYYYTVEVYDANPLIDSAKLIFGAKTNEKTPLVAEIVVPKIQEQVYVRLTDPKGYRYVSTLAVKEGNLLLDYNIPAAPETKTKSFLRSDVDQSTPADYDSFFKSGMNNATEIKKGEAVKVGGTYKITDKSFDGLVDFPNGKFTLYVGEGCKLKLSEKQSVLKNGTEIYILKGATMIPENAQSVDMELDGARIYNAGTVKMQTLTMKNTNSIYPVLYNHPGGKVDLKTLDLNGANVYNHCLINVDDISLKGAGAIIALNENSSLIAKRFTFEKNTSASNIYMASKALLETNKFHKMGENYITFFGDQTSLSSQDYPLIKVNEKMECVNVLIYYSVLVNAKSYSGNIGGSPTYIDGKIPSGLYGDCFGVEYIPGDDDITDDAGSDVYDPQGQETLAYIYMFEDNWPSAGDYDMNDIVVNVGVMNKMEGSNAVTTEITGQLLAVGGTKKLYIMAQIDGTDKVVNLLGGAEAHAFMGKATSEVINTFKYTCAPVPFNLSVDVRGMKGLVNAKNLNVFIVWGDPDSNKRNEVHVAGFKGTKLAATSDSSSKEYIFKSGDEYNNLMWGIMVPKDYTLSYPKEGSSIMEAFPGFNEWAKAGGKGNMDWFTSGVKDKLYTSN